MNALHEQFITEARELIHQATDDLVKLARDTLALVRPVLRVPPVSKALARLARAIEPVFGTGL